MIIDMETYPGYLKQQSEKDGSSVEEKINKSTEIKLANSVIYTGTDEVIFLHHSTGSDASLDLFTFSIRNSKTDSWVFVLVTHGNAPFVLNGSRVMVLNHSQATVDYSQ